MADPGAFPSMGLPGGVNPLDFLHKLATQRGLQRPEFQQLGEQGLPHNKIFMWQCTFNNVVAQATGRSKKEAKVAAARAVRDQLNFDELPPPPTFQSMMEKKKRKYDADGAGHAEGENGDAKKFRRYDYSRHFQCYGGPQPGMMELPYGYLPDRQLANGMNLEGDQMAGAMEGYMYDPYTVDYQNFSNAAPPPAAESGGSSFDPMASMSKGFMSRLSKLDRYVIKRHTEIYPTESHLNTVLKLVSDVEEVMKQASQEWNDVEENAIKIEGLVRVGDLAKGLLLAPDRSVSLVLLCISPPSKSMLQQIHVSARSKIKELDSDHDTLLLEKEAAFAISKPIKDPDNEAANDVMFCYVTFTSTSLRKNVTENAAEEKPVNEESNSNNSDEQDNSADQQPIVKTETENDVESLPSEKCLQALAELRHSRWFSSRAAALPSCVECIRIMRDLTRRDPVWACMSDWAIELLVERALYSAWRPLNPAASLMRVMEVVSSGVLLEQNNKILKDPCEREDSSPVSSLTTQEREDVTKSAQGYLRLMHFRQIYKVLGMQMEDSDDAKEDEKELDSCGKTEDAEEV